MKKKLSWTLDKLCDPAAIAAGDSPLVPSYRAGLEPYIEVFGREAVDIRLFDRSRFIGGNLIADFFAAIGAPDLAGVVTGDVRNPSLSYEAVLLLDQYKAILTARNSQESREKLKAFHGRLKDLAGTRFSLPREMLERIWVAAADDVAWLRRTLGVEVFKKDIYPPETTAGPARSTTTLRQIAEMIEGGPQSGLKCNASDGAAARRDRRRST